MYRFNEEKEQQSMSRPIQPEIKLTPQQTDVQQLSLSEPLQIKEELDLWPSEGAKQLQGLQTDATTSTFPRVKTYCDPEDNILVVQIKAESDEEDYGAPEPAIDSPSTSGTANCPTAQSLEEERRGLLPELTSSCLRTETSPSYWTRPVPSSCSSYDGEDVSSGVAMNRTADKPYQCEECSKVFSQKCDLVQHRRRHTGEKPYQCNECGQAFSKKFNLIQHGTTHTGEKPYKCEQCGQGFSQKSNLVQHRTTHTGEKPYKCEECGQAFSQKGSSIKHRRTHTGEKPYPCENCGQAFSRKDHLVEHRKRHIEEKPLVMCEECGRTFTNKGSLVKHRRIHARENTHSRESV